MAEETALNDLRTMVGTETGLSEWITIDQERINRFAEATGDHQWIHVDEERAAEGPFGSTIAHGYLTLSLIPFLTGRVDPDRPRIPGVRMGINYGVNRVRFPHPVRVGSRLRARTLLQEVAPGKGGIQLVEQVTIEIEGESKPACVAECVTLVYF